MQIRADRAAAVAAKLAVSLCLRARAGMCAGAHYSQGTLLMIHVMARGGTPLPDLQQPRIPCGAIESNDGRTQ